MLCVHRAPCTLPPCVQMLCVELTFGDSEFQLRPDDCDILLQRRTAAGNTLWQKERLLNIAIENLPNTVEKVPPLPLWCDSDSDSDSGSGSDSDSDSGSDSGATTREPRVTWREVK